MAEILIQEEEGFQSEPEIILLRGASSPDRVREQLPLDIICEENDENVQPSNESETNGHYQDQDQDNEDEDDTTGCPICLELWTNSGPHRVCSLRCGHLFGRQCIDRWLAGGRVKCPQCNAPAKRADIRVLYCKKLVVLDTTERDRLEAQVACHRQECKRLEETLAQANLSAQLLRAEMESLRNEFNRLKKRKFSESTRDSSVLPQRKPLKFLRRAILGHCEGFQCRTVAFDPQYGIFLVSRSDSENSGGIVKVSLWDASGSEFVALHDGPVRAIACSPHGDGLFLTCGADDRLRLSTMSSNSVLQTWKLPSNPWSCTFHPGSINHVLVGLSSGQVAMYDLRDNPLQVLPKLFQCPQKSNYPVHSVHVIKINDQFYIVGATMEGPFALKFTDFTTEINRKDFVDSIEPSMPVTWSSDFGYKGFTCNSLSLDPIIRSTFLASYRSVPPREPSRHVVFDLILSDQGQLELKLPFSEFKSTRESFNRTPFRSALISGASNPQTQIIECLIPDESTFSGHSYQFQFSPISTDLLPAEILSTNAGIPIIETCLGKIGKNKQTNLEEDYDNDLEDTLVIGMLTNKHLYIYITS